VANSEYALIAVIFAVIAGECRHVLGRPQSLPG
jgi:hypothetical protein